VIDIMVYAASDFDALFLLFVMENFIIITMGFDADKA
jgi:hypothetical protein